MNQADAERRLEILETQTRRDSLAPLVESLAAQTGFSATELQDEAERLRVTYGSSTAAMERGIAQELGITVEEVRAEAEQVMDVM
jgi:hypothetical protein